METLIPWHYLLIVRLASPEAVPSDSLSGVLAELGCQLGTGGAFESRIVPGTADEPLRRLAHASAAERAMAILHAPHPPAADGQPYQRLWDRTADHGEQIEGWKSGRASLPPLRPGELIRL